MSRINCRHSPVKSERGSFDRLYSTKLYCYQTHSYASLLFNHLWLLEVPFCLLESSSFELPPCGTCLRLGYSSVDAHNHVTTTMGGVASYLTADDQLIFRHELHPRNAVLMHELLWSSLGHFQLDCRPMVLLFVVLGLHNGREVRIHTCRTFDDQMIFLWAPTSPLKRCSSCGYTSWATPFLDYQGNLGRPFASGASYTT